MFGEGERASGAHARVLAKEEKLGVGRGSAGGRHRQRGRGYVLIGSSYDVSIVCHIILFSVLDSLALLLS